jgi:hypothetical protein
MHPGRPREDREEVNEMQAGVQFRGSVPPQTTLRWRTDNWPVDWFVLWSVVPATPQTAAGPQLEWSVLVARTSPTQLSYWIAINNVSTASIDIEGRYVVIDGTTTGST